jgi:hypothetical protein
VNIENCPAGIERNDFGPIALIQVRPLAAWLCSGERNERKVAGSGFGSWSDDDVPESGDVGRPNFNPGDRARLNPRQSIAG